MEGWEEKLEGQAAAPEAAAEVSSPEEVTAAEAPAQEEAPVQEEVTAEEASVQEEMADQEEITAQAAEAPAPAQDFVQPPAQAASSAWQMPYNAQPQYGCGGNPYWNYGQYSWQNPGYAPYSGYSQPVQPQPVQPKTAEKKGGRRFLAALGAAIVAAGLACGITAWIVSGISSAKSDRLLNQMQNTYQARLDALEDAMEQQETDHNRQLEALKKQLGQGVSQSPAQTELPEGMMTPAQLYSSCVSSVVAISNQQGSGITGFTTVGTGSGFVLTEDGYIVTNHHVIDGADKLTVTMSDGMTYDAELVGSDNINDVALLKVDSLITFPAAQIGSSDALQIGDQVVAIGNPLGDLTATATVGYISGKDRPVNTEGIIIDMLQTDAAINSGNSGGPLFNMYGQVVGITTAKYSGTTTSGASIEGIGFAIPIDDVYGMIQDFKNYGYITGGYLGVMVSSMDPDVAELYSLPVGAYVRSVTAGSCAEKAGILAEDIITELGGYEIENLTDLTRALRNFREGDRVSVQVYRAGASVTLTVVLDGKPIS